MSQVSSSFLLCPGDAAPDFVLPDADGHLVAFSDFAIGRGLLVVFACNHCPYVIHLADKLGELAREIAEVGVLTVAINSNDLENYPQDGPGPMKEFSAARRWDFPYLLDESQEIAKAYGAECTPDFFLFDAAGKLFYAGQFDASRPRSGGEAHGGDLRDSVSLMLDGHAPRSHPYPSSGCNIKWKPSA